MSRIAVAKRMGADATVVPIQLFENSFDDPLNRRIAHRLIGSRGLRVVFTFGREDPFFVAMGLVVLSEGQKSRFGQRNHSILSTLSTMNMHHHSFGVDVGDLEIESLLEPESECVDDGEKAQHGWLINEFKKRVDFADSNHDRQFEFATNSRRIKMAFCGMAPKTR